MCKALSPAADVPRNAIRQAKNTNMLLSISQNVSGGESQMAPLTTVGEGLDKSAGKTPKRSKETWLHLIVPYRFLCLCACVGSP